MLRTLVFKHAEMQTKDGRWYLMRIMPYRTAENVIDGVVITFVDINPVKAAEKSLLRMSKVFLRRTRADDDPGSLRADHRCE